jgi:hypothetical protein
MGLMERLRKDSGLINGLSDNHVEKYRYRGLLKNTERLMMKVQKALPP